MLKIDGSQRRLTFKAADPTRIFPGLDPRDFRTAILIVGEGPEGGTSGLIELDPTYWKGSRQTRVYRYRDPAGTAGGVKKILFRPGKLVIKASGPGLPWTSDRAELDRVWVLFRLEQEWSCARLKGKMRPSVGFRARKASAPAGCPASLCGNGVIEDGEACDDGNLDDLDGCTHACLPS